MADITKAVPLTGAKNVLVALPSANVMSIFVDLSKDLGSSSTGKTTIVGSTCGSKPLGGSGVFMGLNVFAKATRNVKALADLKGRSECGTGVVWEILPPHTLHIEVAIATGGGKISGSGKTSIVASSSGNRPIGKSGITFGINCYTKIGAVINLPRLGALVSTAATEIADGVTVDSSDPRWTVFSLDLAGLKVGGAAKSVTYTAPPNVTVAITLFLAVAIPAPADDNDEGAEDAGFAAVEGCTNLETNGGTASPFQLRFDRTLRFDETATGKSISVATTHGFKKVGNVKVNVNAYTASPNKPAPAAPSSQATPTPDKKKPKEPTKAAVEPSAEALGSAVAAFFETQNNEALSRLRMSDVRSFVCDRLKIDALSDAAKSIVREEALLLLSTRLGSDEQMPSLSPVPGAPKEGDDEGEKAAKKARTE